MQSQSKVALAAAPTQPLSAARKRFNSLVRRLEKCRAELRAWETATPRWRERYHEQAVPLFERRETLEVALVQLLDQAHAAHKLSKIDRSFLSEFICELTGPLVEQGHDELKPLYDRHSDIGFDQELAESDAIAKQVIGASFGLDPDEIAAVDSPGELFERVRQRAEAEQAHARQRSERAKAKKAPKKAQAEAVQPLRELYRKLATALHPDRATDPAERERKTALMQRLNQAYKAGNLLALIELQLEIGQLQPEHLQQMSEERIRQYNRDLDRQLKDVEMELLQVGESFRVEYGLEQGGRIKPEKLDALLAQIKCELAEEIQIMAEDLQTLQQPTRFKRWLKQQREMAEDDWALMGDIGMNPRW